MGGIGARLAQANCASVSTAQGRTSRKRASAASGASPSSTMRRKTIMPDRPQPPWQCTRTLPPPTRIDRATSETAGQAASTSPPGAPKSMTGKCSQAIPIAARSRPRPAAPRLSISCSGVMLITRDGSHATSRAKSEWNAPPRPGSGVIAMRPPPASISLTTNSAIPAPSR